jgi:hypothetical protein
MNKGYVIDSNTRTIFEVQIETHDDINKYGGYGKDGFCLGWQFPTRDVMYVDDMGLKKPYRNFFRIIARSDGQPYAGNGIVTGPDVYGDPDVDGEPTYLGTKDPEITIEQLTKEIEWLTRSQFAEWVHAQGDRPSKTITTGDRTIALEHWKDYLEK